MSDDETTTGNDEESRESGQPGISDDQLPDDVRPSEDNPLAEGPTGEEDEDEGMSLGGDDLGA